MSSDLINVLLIGHNDPKAQEHLLLSNVWKFEADNFSVRAVPDDASVYILLALEHTHVIVTFGNIKDYPTLNSLPIEIRRRWLHFEDKDYDLGALAEKVVACFLDVATQNRFKDTPLISVFTPTYKTGKMLNRPYRSLVGQHYNNWEWVIYDDSPDLETFEYATALAARDPRIMVFRGLKPCGVIGEVKRRCCGLARGEILVELDHDDELTETCLGHLVAAFQAFPDAGFAYTDCAELFEDGENAGYGEGYAFGFGSYRSEYYRNKVYNVTNYPSVNAKTIRHIVGVPNHVRAWKRDAYYAAGGYNPEVHVADDYEFLIRTFLTTRMVHIKRLGYLQYLSREGSNTQRRRNKEIQRLVRFFANCYEERIHARFLELGVSDFIWTERGQNWDQGPPPKGFEANYNWPLV